MSDDNKNELMIVQLIEEGEITVKQGFSMFVSLVSESFRKMESNIHELKENLAVINKRFNNLDNVNLEATQADTLGSYIKRYGYTAGTLTQEAWRTFRNFYNIAFNTNLKLKITNYCKDNNIKKLTMPQYFEKSGEMDDAIRVADKMLNELIESQVKVSDEELPQ